MKQTGQAAGHQSTFIFETNAPYRKQHNGSNQYLNATVQFKHGHQCMDRCREPIDIPAVTLLEERRNSTFGNIFMIFISAIVFYELEITRYQTYSAFTMFVVFSGGSHVL